jgi:hypothetical protein
MTLAKARAKASTKAKHIYNTGINYDRHLRSLKYFYSTGHRAQAHFNHKNCSIHMEKQTCTDHSTACTWSVYMGLTSAEGQKLVHFKWRVYNIFIGTMKIGWTLYILSSCQ